MVILRRENSRVRATFSLDEQKTGAFLRALRLSCRDARQTLVDHDLWFWGRRGEMAEDSPRSVATARHFRRAGSRRRQENVERAVLRRDEGVHREFHA